MQEDIKILKSIQNWLWIFERWVFKNTNTELPQWKNASVEDSTNETGLYFVEFMFYTMVFMRFDLKAKADLTRVNVPYNFIWCKVALRVQSARREQRNHLSGNLACTFGSVTDYSSQNGRGHDRIISLCLSHPIYKKKAISEWCHVRLKFRRHKSWHISLKQLRIQPWLTEKKNLNLKVKEIKVNFQIISHNFLRYLSLNNRKSCDLPSHLGLI